MKKLITTALVAMMGLAMNAQTVLPDAFDAKGYIHYFPATKELDYTSSAAGITRTADNGSLKLTIPASVSQKYTGIQTFDITDGSPALIDASANKKLYVKMKATYGIYVKAYPKYGDGGITVKDYGYSKRQLVTCSTGFQWYLFDYSDSTFSDGNNMTEVSEITIEPDLGTNNKDVEITIDSILFGTIGYVPTLPQFVTPTFYNQDVKNADYLYANGTDTKSLVTDGIQLVFSEKDDANRGMNFQINTGSGDASFVNISTFPLVTIAFKGATNDTMRCNLKFGTSRAFLNNFNGDILINGTGEISFDFSTFLGNPLYDLSKIIEVQLLLNPDKSESGTVTITKLEVGEVSENCTGVSVVYVNDRKLATIEAKVYPNPAEAGMSININQEFNTVEILNLNGLNLATLETENNSITLPSSLKSGMYVMVMKGSDKKAFSKFQIK